MGLYKKEEEYDSKNIESLKEHYSKVLELIGEDPSREGLIKTPERVAKAMQFLTQGYEMNATEILQSAIFSEDYSQMVLVKEIEFYSLCEHHLLPFFGKAHIAYIPDGNIVGLSKLPRVVDAFSRRLQVQERLTNEIRDCIQDTLNPKGVAVAIKAEHHCMCTRGVNKPGTKMLTSSFIGEAENNLEFRRSFLEFD